MTSEVCIFAFLICLSWNFTINQDPAPINNAKNITKMTMLDILLNPLARGVTEPDSGLYPGGSWAQNPQLRSRSRSDPGI
jgi:hypothetical protein